jgi:hypothetical protein
MVLPEKQIQQRVWVKIWSLTRQDVAGSKPASGISREIQSQTGFLLFPQECSGAVRWA